MTSSGSSTNTGPGTPLIAWRNASRIAGTMSRAVATEAVHLQMGAKSEIWSMSCRAPRPRVSVAAAPPMSTIGDCAIAAFFTAVIVFVQPGPAVTAATPGTPVRRATASAAKTAFTSWRTSRIRMPDAFAPTSTGEMCPPDSVKTKRTPWLESTLATSQPPSRSVSTSGAVATAHRSLANEPAGAARSEEEGPSDDDDESSAGDCTWRSSASTRRLACSMMGGALIKLKMVCCNIRPRCELSRLSSVHPQRAKGSSIDAS